MKKVFFVTGNQKKIREVQQIVGDKVIVEALKIDLPEPQGEPQEISTAKCLAAAEHAPGPVMVEDTCLCYNALGGLPGPYVKWFLQKTGHSGMYNILAAYEDKSAYALCVMAYYDKATMKEPLLFEGKTDGRIVPARGQNESNMVNFEPVFEPLGFNQTYAEMSSDLKNSISHRGKATRKLLDHLLNY